MGTAPCVPAVKNRLASRMEIGERGVSEEDCAAARKLVELAKGDFALLRLLTENRCAAALRILNDDGFKFRTDDEISRRLEALRDNVNELRMATDGDARTFDAVLAQLATYEGRPIAPGKLAKLVALARKVDIAPLTGLSGASSPTRLLHAMGKLMLDTQDVAFGSGLAMSNEPIRAEEMLQFYSLGIAAICARCDDNAVRGFRDALYSSNAGTMLEVLSLVESGDVTVEGEDAATSRKIERAAGTLHHTVTTGLMHVLHDILGVKDYERPPYESPHELTEADVMPIYDALRPVALQIDPAHQR